MARYLDFSYLEDTYGDRVRPEVPIKMVDLGYDINAVGDTVANVVVEVGPISWNTDRPAGYPVGSRVAVMRSYNFYPPNPDRFLEEAKYNPVDDSTEFLYRDNGSMILDEMLESGNIVTFRSGKDPLGVVKPGSTLYIAVYVSEPFQDSTGRTIWLPWDLRGQAHLVVPDNHGGVASALDAMPRGVMTGGLIYGEHIMNPQTIFVSALGYILDTVVTHGEQIIAEPERLHPNMVLPMLRGMGMSSEEEGFFVDRTVRHRLKNILFRYRGISAAKGTMYALERYVEAATGLESVIAGPLNLLLDRSDTCPDNPYMGQPSNANMAYSVGYTGGVTKWVAVPSVGFDQDYTGTETPVHPPIAGLLEDGVTPDPWFDAKSPSTAGAAVHKLQVQAKAFFHSGKGTGTQLLPKVDAGSFYNLRFRFRIEHPSMTAVARLVFWDDNGPIGQSVSAAVSGVADQWVGVTGDLALAPAGARYVDWQIELTGSGAVSLGAIQLAEGNIPAKYRDPRSVAIVLKTGEVPVRDSWVTMDSPVVQMDDTVVTMDDGRYYGHDTTVDSFERVLIAKLTTTLDRYLLPGVPVHVITTDDVEFTRYWREDYA